MIAGADPPARWLRRAMTLNARAWIAIAALALVMGALLFGTAGSVSYWQAWLYLAVFFFASVLTTIDLMRRDPALLERRMRGGPTAEREPAQRVIMPSPRSHSSPCSWSRRSTTATAGRRCQSMAS